MSACPQSLEGVIVLGGPTAAGKTVLAIALAEALGAEIVNADSRQIYRGMSIGTAAPSAAQRARVPHHLVEFLDPHERYSAARFVRDAMEAIDQTRARGKRVVVAGGTGFYLRALCGDVVLGGERDVPIRDRLAREARVHPAAVLHAWLSTLAPARAAVLAPGDGYRVVRALEDEFAGRSRGDRTDEQLDTLRSRAIPFQKFVLRVDPATLAERIGVRTDAMLASGIVDEAVRLGGDVVAADAVGYRESLAYFEGQLSVRELRDLLARNTRRYAKRQATWFRSEPGVAWIDAASIADARDAILGAVAHTSGVPSDERKGKT